MKLTGAQALIKSLEMEGVEVMFGLPGGAILPVYDPLIDSSIRHILVRHEQGAGHMASGLRARDRPARRRDGHERSRGDQHRHAALRRVHGLDPDRRDHRSGRVLGDRHRRVPGGRHRRHHDAGHEAQLVRISDVNDIPRVVREAFHVATTGRPGPVLVDLPKDIANQTMEWYWPEKVDLPGYKPNVKGHPKQIKDAARLINEAKQPVIYAGGGILKANATNELRELAELTGIPVVTTLMARGVLPDEHPLCLGMPGMHGNYTAVTSMQKADLLITLGARFDDRVTGKVSRRSRRRQGHPRRHRPGRARQGAPRRRADRRRRAHGDRRADQGGEGRAGQARRARHSRRGSRSCTSGRPTSRSSTTQDEGGPLKPQFVIERAARQHARRLHPRGRRRPAPDVGEPALEVQASRTRG